MRNNNLYAKLAKSSKSQAEDWLPTILFVIFIVFLAIFLLLPTQLNKGEKEEILRLQTTIIDSQKLLVDYLSLPLDLDAAEVNIADAITSYSLNQDENTLQKIKDRTYSFFSKSGLETAGSSWSLEINNGGKGSVIIESKESESARKQQSLGLKQIKSQKEEIAKIIIPSQNFEVTEIRLFYLKFG